MTIQQKKQPKDVFWQHACTDCKQLVNIDGNVPNVDAVCPLRGRNGLYGTILIELRQYIRFANRNWHWIPTAYGIGYQLHVVSYAIVYGYIPVAIC